MTFQCSQNKLPVYDETGTSPKEIAVSDLIIGSETLSYILDSGRICAIVRRQAPDLTYIRVLIKNDGKDAFPTIAAAAAANLYVDDAGKNITHQYMPLFSK